MKLYSVVPIVSPLADRAEVKRHNTDCEVEGFDYALIAEYLKD